MMMFFFFVALAFGVDPGYRDLVRASNADPARVATDAFFCQVAEAPEDVPARSGMMRVELWRDGLNNAYAVQVVAVIGETLRGEKVDIRTHSIFMLREYEGREVPSIAVIGQGEGARTSGAVLSGRHLGEDEHCVGYLPRGRYRIHFRLIRLYLGEHTGTIPFLVPGPPKDGLVLIDTRRYEATTRHYSRKAEEDDVRIRLSYAKFE